MTRLFTFMLLLATLTSPVAAQSVLLPSQRTNNPPQPLPNVAPTQPSTTAPQSPAATNPTVAITPGGTVAPATAQPGIMSEAEMQAMMRQAGIVDPTKEPTPEQQNRLQQLIQKKYAQQFARPTTVMDEPTTPELPEIYQRTLPSSLNIAVAPRYVWGASDVAAIENQLGYSPQQVPANCQLRQDVQISSPRSVSQHRIFSGQQMNVKFAGNIESMTLMPKAVCTPPKDLPQTGGVVMRSGKLYVVMLSGISTCPPPDAKAKALEIQYLGDGKVNCVYR